MKAAVINQQGQPQIIEVPVPTVKNDEEVLVSVIAVALKHFDKGRVRGTHYSSDISLSTAKIIGGDGVCLLDNGTRVYGMGMTGMLAEKAIIEKDRIVTLPAGIDNVAAAALPNAVIGSAMALKFKAKIQQGETVLINGATGFTGRLAVQLARHYGAGRIIVTGRNEKSLHELIDLGADEVISLNQNDEDIICQVKGLHVTLSIDIFIDYLWGHTTELLLRSLKGAGSFTHKTRFVSVGSATGDIIQLSAANLRSVDIEISGSGLGSWTKTQVRELFLHILPEMFQLAAEKRLKVETVTEKFSNIASLWESEAPSGKRIVVTL